jgi:hypothetical protein
VKAELSFTRAESTSDNEEFIAVRAEFSSKQAELSSGVWTDFKSDKIELSSLRTYLVPSVGYSTVR